MTKQMPLQPITDEREAQRLQSLINEMGDGSIHLDADWIINNRWIAIPVESASHFAEEQAKMLSRAMQGFGHTECFAVATEPLENFPLCFRVLTTTEGLLEFSYDCGDFSFVLVPENRSFAILCTDAGYFIVGGRREFATQAIGGDLNTARAEFYDFASDDFWEGWMLTIARKYENLSRKAINQPAT
jgi:hypothetical protein